MPDRHDNVDAWLSERIEPLPPPPGTFDLIKRRARRRKYRKLAITAGSAAVIVAAAVTVPQVVNLPVLNPKPAAAPVGAQSRSTAPSASSSASGASGNGSQAASSAVPSGPAPVPGNFRPTSVTFVGPRTGWVIGQALTPGHCATQVCTSVARTDDAGRAWIGVPAPMAGAPDGASGLSQIRFLDLTNGWAYGPQLFATHTGGGHWAQVDTGGLRVTALETVGDRVFAVWASCTGDGPAFAVNCTRFTLYSASATGGTWAPVGASTTGLTNGAASEAVQLVLTGSRGYLLGPGGELYSGPVDGSGPWTRVSSRAASCPVGPARGNGQPTGALLGAVNASDLLLACASASSGTSPSVSTQQKFVYSSKNGGMSWAQMTSAPAAGVAFGLAASPTQSVMLATDQGIDLLPAGEMRWRTADVRGGAPAGGFRYIGMTTDEQGIALPADPPAGTVWFTFDGGQSWTASRLNGS
ncbi:MAG TPA: hypothetical protein VE888_15380 [Streptosporangiaceae bacterium]|nr:hypothetical protein [Streptosporangiaceae bacterium]